MVATPFLHDAFIHYFTPVYPDAIQATGLPHFGAKPYCCFISFFKCVSLAFRSSVASAMDMVS